ncbi:hypothetical protein [Methanobacterium sp.]
MEIVKYDILKDRSKYVNLWITKLAGLKGKLKGKIFLKYLTYQRTT